MSGTWVYLNVPETKGMSFEDIDAAYTEIPTISEEDRRERTLEDMGGDGASDSLLAGMDAAEEGINEFHTKDGTQKCHPRKDV